MRAVAASGGTLAVPPAWRPSPSPSSLATGGSGTTKQASTGPAGEDRAFELLNGGSGTFEAYRGKPLVVNFFASVHAVPG